MSAPEGKEDLDMNTWVEQNGRWTGMEGRNQMD